MDSLGASDLILIGLAIAFPTLLTIAAIGDLARFLIPNWICLALAGLSIPALLLAGSDLSDLLWHLAVGLIVLGLLSVLFFRGLIGGGDVKLLAAASCWAGWPLILAFFFYTAIAGGLLALTLIIVRTVFRNHKLHDGWPKSLLDPASGIPYGIAIAVGGWLIWAKMSVFSTAFSG